jgi:UDP-4-amino-4,6-dideoxy-N-acetyl-beta-L-altrosamine N-acetyltransferase
MTEVSKYGVSFRRLDLESLEMVRAWRNSDDVRSFMQYQALISSEEQLRWFDKINNPQNYYFVAYDGTEPVGLYNIKDIQDGRGECGAFLKDKTLWEGGIDMKFSFLLLHVAFELLQLDHVICEILKTNLKVIQYNKQLGYQLLEDKENTVVLKLTWADFLNSKGAKLLKYLEKVS